MCYSLLFLPNIAFPNPTKTNTVTDYTTYFDANKALWNAKTPVHIESDFYQQEQFLKEVDSLCATEKHELGDVDGKRLLHLQCHFGQDTLSWAKKGASVTGIDLADKAIDKANAMAQQLDLDARFICSNVYDIDQHLNGEQFDIVFTSYGTIGWLPDLTKWAKQISQHLKQGGTFYMIDFHPFVWSLDDNYEKFFYDYFNTQVIEETVEGTYADREADIKMKEYGWNHPTSELINALLGCGLQLEFFNEFNFSHYNCFPNMEEVDPGKWQFKHLRGTIPYMYSLMCKKL